MENMPELKNTEGTRQLGIFLSVVWLGYLQSCDNKPTEDDKMMKDSIEIAFRLKKTLTANELVFMCGRAAMLAYQTLDPLCVGHMDWCVEQLRVVRDFKAFPKWWE